MVPLDKNESYWLLDDELAEAAGGSGIRELSAYPDYAEFKERLAEYAGTTASRIVLTAGSDAAIEAIAEALVGAGEPALLPIPTFYGYERILERAGVSIVPLPYAERDGRFVFPTDETLAAMATSGAKALFLCHPNNPLGCPIPDDALGRMLDGAQAMGMYVVLDEAYFEFSGRTLIADLPAHDRLVIVRTLSKGFGLSGARIGYTISAEPIADRIGKRLLPWPVSHLAIHAATALLGREEHVAARRELVIDAREELAEALSANPSLTVYPSETNFLLVRVPDAGSAASLLAARGVRVATGEWMSGFPEAKALLKDVLRIAVPSTKDMPQVLDILSKI